jgi:hypothetical protein
MWYRDGNGAGGWQSWKQIATVDCNIATASKLQTARKITLTGDVTGNVTFDGSANAVINTTIPNLVPHGKQIYTSSGTFVVPNNVTEVWLTMAGGGGGNGYYHKYDADKVEHYYCTYYGGRGATCFMKRIAVTSGASIAVTVGAAGTSGTVATSLKKSASSNGTAGGASSFGSFLTCTGGGAGSGTAESKGTNASLQEITLSWGSVATPGIVIVEW